MEIPIKNMVCHRCIMVVEDIFKNAGYPDAKVEMGKVTLDKAMPQEKHDAIHKKLNEAGFEILSDSKKQIIEQIKNLCIRYVYEPEEGSGKNFSDYLTGKLFKDYSYLSALFSSVEGQTIEKYLISLKIERIKELLVYGEKNLSEIAYELNYSSVAHLSGQFKKVTGFSPSWFKKLGQNKRKSLDDV